MEKKPKRGRWIAFGLVLGLVAVWGGSGIADGAPSTIKTCTRKNGTIKVAPAGVCKGKDTLDSWDHHNTVVSLQSQVATLTNQINTACVNLAVDGAEPGAGGVFPTWPNAIAAHTTHTAGFLYRYPSCTGHLTLH